MAAVGDVEGGVRDGCAGEDAVLRGFRLATYDRDKASELVKRLVGPRTSSPGGTYVVRRKGLLDEIPHVRLVRGVVIVRGLDAAKIIEFLRYRDADVHARAVTLTREPAHRRRRLIAGGST